MNDRKKVIKAELETAHRELVDLARSLDAEALALPTGSGLWNVQELITHLATFLPRHLRDSQLMSRGEKIPDERRDEVHQNNVELVKQRHGRSLDETLVELDENKTSIVAFLETVPDSDLDRMGEASDGQAISVAQSFQRVAQHYQAHCADIAKAVTSHRDNR